jgi:predicted alpha/beta superfamily hydrolase
MKSTHFYKMLLIGALLLPLSVWCQLRMEVTLPANTPANSSIYVAGSFNNWSANNTAYRLTPNANQSAWSISLDVAPGTYEFKFTRGSWPTVEGTATGAFRPNRTVTYTGGQQTATYTIAGWEDVSGSGGGTAAPNVEVLSNSFAMPQLNRERKIWVYLPPDYYTSSRTYPVMYMHDGQNLFDDALSFSGEWGVDESLNTLFSQGDEGIIIIGIENGGANRLPEYTPWSNPTYGGGQGAEYVDFIVETLKPYVDANYRTLPDRDHTGIMGSSLGGLISLYAAIRHQDVFGKAGIFSPSLWFTNDIYTFVQNTGKQADMRIALLAGEQESASMIAQMQQMYTTLRNAGFGTDELSLRTHADGQHSEWYWRREFPTDYQWLFQDLTYLQGSFQLRGLSFWPNPSQDFIYLDGLPNPDASNWTSVVYDPMGRKVAQNAVTQSRISLQGLRSGTYFVVVFRPGGDWGVLHVVKN